MIITDRTAEEIKLAAGHVHGEQLIEARGEMAIDGSTVTAILERDEVQSLILAAKEDARDILVIEPGGGTSFLVKAADILRIGGHLGR